MAETAEEVLQRFLDLERLDPAAGGIIPSNNEMCFEGRAAGLIDTIAERYGASPTIGTYCTSLLALSIDAEIRPDSVEKAEEKELLDMFGHMLLERGIPDTDANKRALANIARNAALDSPNVNILEIPLDPNSFEWGVNGLDRQEELAPFTLTLAGATTLGYLGEVVPAVREARSGAEFVPTNEQQRIQSLPQEARDQVRAISDACYSNLMNSNLTIGACMGAGAYEGIMQITPEFLNVSQLALPPASPTSQPANAVLR